MPSENDPLRFTSLAADLQDQPSEALTAKAILGRTADVVPEAEHVSLTVRRQRRFVTLAATSGVAEDLDELQYAFEEGPCVFVASTDTEYVRSTDVAVDPRWPRWGPPAAAAGARSLLSVQLTARGERVGALNMYATELARFDDPQTLDDALLYATHVAYALAGAQLVAGLQTAMGSRHVIGLAQGILMERYGLDPDAAFSVLRRLSSSQHRKLVDLADELARTRRLEGLQIEPALRDPREGAGAEGFEGEERAE